MTTRNQTHFESYDSLDSLSLTRWLISKVFDIYIHCNSQYDNEKTVIMNHNHWLIINNLINTKQKVVQWFQCLNSWKRLNRTWKNKYICLLVYVHVGKQNEFIYYFNHLDYVKRLGFKMTFNTNHNYQKQ